MPNNDKDFYDNLDKYIDEASKNTDKKLALYLSSVTVLKEDELLKLFPETDKLENLSELIQLVTNATNHNEKLIQFIQNIDKYGATALKLITKMVV